MRISGNWIMSGKFALSLTDSFATNKLLQIKRQSDLSLICQRGWVGGMFIGQGLLWSYVDENVNPGRVRSGGLYYLYCHLMI